MRRKTMKGGGGVLGKLKNTSEIKVAQRRIKQWIESNDVEEILDLSNLNLTTLPNIPDNVEALECRQNKLTTLPTLPNNLEVLDCAFNKLINLPTLPDSLTYLNCNYNNLPHIFFKRYDETMKQYIKRIRDIQKVQENLKSHITNKKRNTFAKNIEGLPENVMREVASYMNSNNLKNININSLKPSNITRKKKKNNSK